MMVIVWCFRVASYSSMTSRHRSSPWATVPQGSGWLSGTFSLHLRNLAFIVYLSVVRKLKMIVTGTWKHLGGSFY